MRNELHTRKSPILFGACLIAVLLPVAVLFSLEKAAPPEVPSHAELAVAIPVSRVAPSAIDWTSDWSGDWTRDAAQSASMVLVGSLLIGIGSVVRRSVNL
jgi:hypothetical protein